MNPTGVVSQVSVHDIFEDFDLSLIQFDKLETICKKNPKEIPSPYGSKKERLLHSLLKPNSDPLMSMNPIIDLIVSNSRAQAYGCIY